MSKPTSSISSITAFHARSHIGQAGFTLVEIVVVVVILSIFAGMMSLSVGSSESRKNRAFYEHLTDSLSYVRLLSAERDRKSTRLNSSHVSTLYDVLC